ncbi:MAG: deoxyguanosinetriphosphate triphosphohydrolase [Chakrabartia sp.]
MPGWAAYACNPDTSRGRQYADRSGGARGPRTAFQRDRDRIIHSISFRRLRHKTQVFVAPDGDHFRVRLTHSIEVAQIGRTIARALGLDEDLTEALCLAHDLGHPPFGHAGEDGLEAAMTAAGGFDHNGHSLRILTRLERAYPDWPGLNLSWETLEGLAKHNGPVYAPGWAMQEVDAGFPLDLAQRASLEAQVAAIADDIAYDNHDIDDGLRAGLLDFAQVIAAPLVKDLWPDVRDRLAGVEPRLLAAELVRTQIGAMVNDVIAETRARLAAHQIGSEADVRAAPGALVGFSPAVAAAEAELKAFMYANLYHHPRQLEIAATCRRIVAELFAAYRAEPALLPPEWRQHAPKTQPALDRHIADFIAGMTDRYAIERYRTLIGPVDLPDNF